MLIALSISGKSFNLSFIGNKNMKELKPEYLQKLQNVRRGKYTQFHSIEELRKATS